MNPNRRQYRDLRAGQAFTFYDEEGVVYVRCRGGFRSARGGPLCKNPPSYQIVFLYQSEEN
jgi:hypothetical protein